MYIGPQGIVHGTYNTLLNAGRIRFALGKEANLKGRLFVSSGLGGMSGAQGKAVVICPAGHSIDHLDEIGIADAMRRVMVDDRLLGVGIKTAHMEILGGMVPGDAKVREGNLDRAREDWPNVRFLTTREQVQ